MNLIELKKKARELRRATLDMCVKAEAGHITTAFSCTEILVTLYYSGILRFKPEYPSWSGRDRFILSKGHACTVLYLILADLGFFPEEWLDTFCQKDGRLGIHLEKNIPGVEITTGSLGHGLGVAVGMALAAKMDKEHHFIFALLSDGECFEGSTWESAMLAGHHRLNNLIAIVDRNWQCATDFTENCVKLNPLADKWKAFSWDVIDIDGHSFDEIFSALDGFRCKKRNKPLVIIADTVKGKGISFMEYEPLWHGRVPKGEEIKQTRRQLQIAEVIYGRRINAQEVEDDFVMKEVKRLREGLE